MTVILGISAYYHDSAAAILCDGKLIAAAQEERFTRVRQDSAFPEHAVAYVLRAAGVTLSDVDWVAFYDKPFLKFERLLETYVGFAPSGLASFRTSIPIWIKDKLFQKRQIVEILSKEHSTKFDESKLLFAEHHISHAASAYYPSPFDESVVLTIDGVGEWSTTMVSIGRPSSLMIEKEIHFPHSLGLLYSAFTYYLGFKVNSGEYKVMGLAPYGFPRFKNLILDHLVDLKADGSFRLDQKYFNYCTGLTMTDDSFADLFGQPVRKPETELMTSFHMDVAASVQAVTEEVLLRMTSSLASEYGIPNLCLAGGVALNCVANGKVLRSGAFKNIWIQPASGDAGGAPGAAWAAWHGELGHPKKPQDKESGGDGMSGAYLGPSFEQAEIEERLKSSGAVFDVVSDEGLIRATAEALAEGQAVGWFQGRMEFGPRALGARSILGDARSDTMQRTLNLKVKFRESFRPFAPSILRERVADWFELNSDSPYMLLVADVLPHLRREMTSAEKELFGIDKLNIKRSDIPAVTHVDYSARVQTVDAETNPRYHALISAFAELTDCPILVNTSFNVRGEPIVCTPEDAFQCFMGTDLDLLSIGNCLLRKPSQNDALRRDYRSQYELD